MMQSVRVLGSLGRPVRGFNGSFVMGRNLATGAQPSSNLLVLGDDNAFEKVRQDSGKKVLYFTATWLVDNFV
jgi:hypothetical protein